MQNGLNNFSTQASPRNNPILAQHNTDMQTGSAHNLYAMAAARKQREH